MNNLYITNDNVNYRAFSDLRTFLKQEITTVDEYVLWVREWKIQEKQIAAAVRYFKAAKNQAKLDKNPTACNVFQGKKLTCRTPELYDRRVENKARLHAGEFKETELA